MTLPELEMTKVHFPATRNETQRKLRKHFYASQKNADK